MHPSLASNTYSLVKIKQSVIELCILAFPSNTYCLVKIKQSVIEPCILPFLQILTPWRKSNNQWFIHAFFPFFKYLRPGENQTISDWAMHPSLASNTYQLVKIKQSVIDPCILPLLQILTTWWKSNNLWLSHGFFPCFKYLHPGENQTISDWALHSSLSSNTYSLVKSKQSHAFFSLKRGKKSGIDRKDDKIGMKWGKGRINTYNLKKQLNKPLVKMQECCYTELIQ